MNDAAIERSMGTAYRNGDKAKLVVQAVAHPDGSPEVAYLETCQVWDADNVVLRSGAVRELLSGTQTIQRTEEMRREGGSWKLAQSNINSLHDGVTGCATDDAPAQPASELRSRPDPHDVIEARTAAEHAWLDYLTSPNGTVPATNFTVELLTWFGDADSVQAASGRLLRRDCIPVWNAQTKSGTASRECTDRLWAATAMGAQLLRSQGVIFAPTSKATAAVESVTFPPDKHPTVAYLHTCRTYQLARKDGRPDDLPPDATVRATEAMRFDAGEWKLATSWAYQVDPSADRCR